MSDDDANLAAAKEDAIKTKGYLSTPVSCLPSSHKTPTVMTASIPTWPSGEEPIIGSRIKPLNQ
jgi:hypothetical protein